MIAALPETILIGNIEPIRVRYFQVWIAPPPDSLWTSIGSRRPDGSRQSLNCGHCLLLFGCFRIRASASPLTTVLGILKPWLSIKTTLVLAATCPRRRTNHLRKRHVKDSTEDWQTRTPNWHPWRAEFAHSGSMVMLVSRSWFQTLWRPLSTRGQHRAHLWRFWSRFKSPSAIRWLRRCPLQYTGYSNFTHFNKLHLFVNLCLGHCRLRWYSCYMCP